MLNLTNTLDDYFLEKAKEEAQKSSCLRRKVGAVLVAEGKRILSKAANGPRAFEIQCSDKGCLRKRAEPGQSLKECWGTHAEKKALDGVYLEEDLTLYVTHAPCYNCALTIIAQEIKRVVYLEDYPDKTGIAKLKLNGIEVVKFEPAYTFEEYQNKAARTIPNEKYKENLSNFCISLMGECGEFLNICKKILYHDHKPNMEEIEEEAADILWYLSAVLTLHDRSLGRAAAANIKKLEKRYPSGFDPERSQRREV